MQIKNHQLKQIVQYNPDRMYFGNWSGAMLNSLYDNVAKTSKTEPFYVGKLDNTIICNNLWYEMSYNPKRFGTVSPFKNNNKSDIIYFNDTYKQKVSYQTEGLLPDEIVNLAWNISVFIKNLKKSDLYDNFMATGELPNSFKISKAKSLSYDALSFGTQHSILLSLLGAIKAITNQNIQDLRTPTYRDEIIRTIQHRHPTGKRSDISYMLVNDEFELSPEYLEILKEQKVKIETKIKSLETELNTFLSLNFTESFNGLRPELDDLTAQYESVCKQEQKLSKYLKQFSRC